MADLSVIICTHNPRLDYLNRVLGALKLQTLALDRWELLLIDNACDELLERRIDLGWHPHGRILRVEKLGKVAALLGSLHETTGELLVIVDDDNVLNHDYLSTAIRLCQEWPILGVLGGSILAEFEEAPAVWAQPYLRYLALREVNRDQWSNLSDPEYFGLLPWGAGMIVRRGVAVRWARTVCERRTIDVLNRLGSGCGCEDTDIALTACDLGLGTGLFSSLRLNHLIRAERVRESYLLRLVEGMVYSLHIMAAVRGRPPRRLSWPRWLWGQIAALKQGLREFRFHRASMRGRRAALDEVSLWERATSRPELKLLSEPTGKPRAPLAQ